MIQPEAAAPHSWLGGKLRLVQASTGHRVGTDAALLAAVSRIDRGLAIDLGCGVGAAGLAVAIACPESSVRLIDNATEALALAARNIALNNLAQRAAVVAADALAPAAERRKAGLAAGSADLVLTNPPFGVAERMRASPDAARASAHMMPKDGLSRWIACAADLLKPRGVLTMIHRADALGDILAALPRDLGGVAIRPVHPRADQPATRILFRAVKQSKTPLALLPPLVLHDVNGPFTPLADALHRGEAALPF